ncbi:MAG: ExeA family protein, partial [Desulfovibrionaceae bacterium]
MQYYSHIGLHSEPFSNSPDPAYLYLAPQHIQCLQQMEISVRLRRGLSVVIGPVGTGKTTLCRHFVRHMTGDDVRVHLMLDPAFPSALAFLKVLCAQITGERPDPGLSEWGLKERIKRALLRWGVHENKIVLLIIDEGQKISRESLEILRELLNYETNSSKLLQIVIFAQPELEPVIASMENFLDRVNCYMALGPLSAKDMRAMIDFRIDRALGAGRAMPDLFTRGALRAVYRATRGFPRKVVRLCHRLVLALMVEHRDRITSGMVREVLREQRGLPGRRGWRPVWAAAAVLLLVGGLATVRYVPEVRGLFPGLERAGAAVQPVSDLAGATENVILARVSPDAPVPAVEDRAPAAPASEASPEATPDAASIRGNGPHGGDGRDAGAEVAPETAADLAPAVVAPSAGRPAPAAAAATADPGGLPAALGRVRVLPLENVSQMMRNIYGVYDAAGLEQMRAANPGIADLERVPVGAPLVFPVSRDMAGQIPADTLWVRLEACPDLDSAYAALRKYAFFGLGPRVLAAWSEARGLSFAVVLGAPFTDEAEARATIQTLPL